MNSGKLDVKSILSDMGNFKHGLVFYTPDIDKGALQASLLATTEKNEKVIYVTNDDPDSGMKKFNGLGANISILRPEKLSTLKPGKRKLKIIFDAASIAKEDHAKYEKCLTEGFQKNSSISCVYDVTKIDPAIIKDLVAHHDKLILTSGDISILSSESIDKVIKDDSIERYVKNDLKMIIFALLMNKPMCGTDMIKAVHKNFNVFLSPGTIYPLLHTLEKKGMIQYEYVVKKKIYKLVDISLHEVKDSLEEHIKISGILTKFLLSDYRNKKQMINYE
ncbi:MAG: PadR family transcriptional regulator [Candidatus Aenigmarchaeota archaeon]|nr:PadR family transcriptional regulator [Candidatus Aenigmarchaeota archaeon]